MVLAPTLSDDTDAEPPHPYRWAMLGGVWLLYFAFALAIASMAPLVYRLLADLGMDRAEICLLYTSPSPRDVEESRMPSSA